MQFRREIRTNVAGRDVVIENTWGKANLSTLLQVASPQGGLAFLGKILRDETKIIIDGKAIETTKNVIFPWKTTILKSEINADGVRYLLEVHAKAGLLKNLIQLRINNEKVAGDDI